MKVLVRFLCVVLIGSLSPLVTPAVHAANAPVWAATIPPASFPSKISSSVSLVRSSSPNCTLVVIDYINSGPVGTNSAGSQFLLFNGKGQLLASGEIPSGGVTNSIVVPLLITPRKVQVLLSGVPNEATVDASKKLVFKPLSLEKPGESLTTTAGVTNFDGKSIFTSVATGGFVTEIRRYSLLKLKP